jgi:hypothetical protein
MMENKKFVCTENRPQGMERGFTGSQGPLRTVVVENKKKKKKKRKKKKKKKKKDSTYNRIVMLKRAG